MENIVWPGVRKKIRAFNQLHRKKPTVIIAEQLVELHKVGMNYVNKRTKLVLEPRQVTSVQSPQSFECDHRIPLAIQNPVHDAESALAKPLLNNKSRSTTEFGGCSV
jgi:hypothetical protein